MKKISISEATNTQLDWLVAKCEGEDVVVGYDGRLRFPPAQFSDEEVFTPTTNPAQMWPIIEREDIAIGHGNSKAHPDNRYEAAIIRLHQWAILAQGPTKLIAAARCYVVSKLGEEVEVPEELM